MVQLWNKDPGEKDIMAAAYASDMGTVGSMAPPAKLTKSRSKMPTVKPILKKKGTSPSAKSSLDLDRTWEEQIHYGSHGWGGGLGSAADLALREGGTHPSSTRDVSFDLSMTGFDASPTDSRTKYSHARSTSGASHASIATSGSGPGSYRNASTFVHPFQQTPRTATPPLSYTNSFSFEPAAVSSNARDYSPTITEDEDLENLDGTTYSFARHSRNGSYQNAAHSVPSQALLSSYTGSSNTNSSGSNTTATTTTNTATTALTTTSSSTSAPRRPSLASNRTSSLSDINTYQAQRVNTNRSTSNSNTSRLAHVSSTSDLNLLIEGNESPASSSAAAASTLGTTAPLSSSFSLTSPISPSAMSPLRTSLEGFRLRSRSDIDSGTQGSYAYQAERIRQERQKWLDKENAKALKREKKERERAVTNASPVTTTTTSPNDSGRFDDEQAAVFRSAEALAKRDMKERKGAARRASDEDEAEGDVLDAGDPDFGAAYMSGDYPQARKKRNKAQQNRKRLTTKVSKMNIPRTVDPSTVEKLAFVGRDYDDTDQGEAPTAAQEVTFGSAPRRTTAKRKTMGAWTNFVLWFRSRILRLQDKLEK